MKLIMLINVKIPTIVDILSFISIINTTSESVKFENQEVFIIQKLSFDEELQFNSQLS